MNTFVELERAQSASGVRIVTSGVAPSPWSEAAKGTFRVAGIPVLLVRRGRDTVAIDAWTGATNTPVVFNDHDPPRVSWAAIVALAARLAPNTVLPEPPAARAELMGALELVAGEDGLGWNVRMSMIHAGLETKGERGFPLPVATYLASRYGHTPQRAARLRDRIVQQLQILETRLERKTYFGGTTPNALDVYVATFLSIVSPLDEATCPNLGATMRKAFAAGAADIGPLLPSTLVALRARMFAEHLAWPIDI